MSYPTELLRAYDEQLRTDLASAISTARLGPLHLGTYLGGRGFVTYRDLGNADRDGVFQLVEAVVAHYRSDPTITRVEWKSRGHDRAPGLGEALSANGFEAQESESIMIGEARLLAGDTQLPDGVTLRQITAEKDVRQMCAMVGGVFGDADEMNEETATALLHRMTLDDGMELWVAEADGQMVSAGRLEPVPGTEFAGIWGGATRAEWRSKGIYRALTAARAQSALRMGKRLINSDSTEDSRPILERAGLIKVSTTTPYHWRNPLAGD